MKLLWTGALEVLSVVSFPADILSNYLTLSLTFEDPTVTSLRAVSKFMIVHVEELMLFAHVKAIEHSLHFYERFLFAFVLSRRKVLGDTTANTSYEQPSKVADCLQHTAEILQRERRPQTAIVERSHYFHELISSFVYPKA
jgi:hypothetical protein